MPLVSVYVPPGDLAKLERLNAAIRNAPKELQKELATGLRKAVRPMPRIFRQGALGFLPHRGGLGEWVASGMRFRTTVSVGANPRLRITGSLPGHDLAALNSGTDRHPTYGHRDRWVSQRIRPAWWDDAGVLAANEAGDEIVAAVDRAGTKLEASA